MGAQSTEVGSSTADVASLNGHGPTHASDDPSAFDYEKITASLPKGVDLDRLVMPDEAREQLHQLIRTWPCWGELSQHYAGLFDQHRNGACCFVFLHGAPGTGKTAAARAVADCLGLTLRGVSIPQLVSEYIGVTARNIDLVLTEAERRGEALLFDEMDALAPQRTSEGSGQGDQHQRQVIATLLTRLQAHAGLVFGTSNRTIDKALFDRAFHAPYFPEPTKEDRIEMWRLWMQDLKLDVSVEQYLDLEELLRQWAVHPLSGRGIARVVELAALEATSQGNWIGVEDIEAQLQLQFPQRH